MDWNKRIDELACRLRRDVGGPHEGWVETLMELKDEFEKELIRKGMGEAPVSEERLAQIRADIEAGWVTFAPDIDLPMGALLKLVDHLQARIAFLSHDNESWQDGYRRGLEDGRREPRCNGCMKPLAPDENIATLQHVKFGSVTLCETCYRREGTDVR